MPIHYALFCVLPHSHSWQFALTTLVSLSFSAGSSSSFTQNRGQDNNVKYLKAKLGYKKIKTQVPKP